jgi:histone-lysine N-methyltransferase SETMAR
MQKDKVKLRFILLTEFMAPGTTMTSKVYCEMLNNLQRSIQNKWHGMLTKSVVLPHDNMRPYAAVRTNALLKPLNWEIFDHLPYSPDLMPNNHHLFTKMKVWLATQPIHTNKELMEAVNNWLHNLAAPLFDEGLEKLVSRYANCLNTDGN